jgi:hypothetical protein
MASQRGLRLLKEQFEGKYWDAPGQVLFYQKLVERSLIGPEGAMPSPQTQGINGRKWASASNQLGLARAWAQKSKGPVVITPAGQALLDATDEKLQQEVFLRQFLKYRLPSLIERGSAYAGFDVVPYRLTLKVIYELYHRGLRGATKEEIALFLITTVRNGDADRAVQRIIDYRNERANRVGLVAKRKFFREALARRVREIFAEEFEAEYRSLRRIARLHKTGDSQTAVELLREIAGGGKGSQTQKAQEFVREATRILGRGGFDEIKNPFDRMRLSVRGGTFWDYADTTVRYCAITGLFSLSGDKMVLADEKLPLIEQLLSEGFPAIRDDEYLGFLYAADQPTLPTDDLTFLRSYVVQLEKRRATLKSTAEVEPTVEAKPPGTSALLELKRYRLELEAENAEYREILFYKTQSTPEAIENIRGYFDGIRRRVLLGGETYLPAFLEWTAWRVFLAINRLACPVSETRNFAIDEELNPLHHARGGVADMVFGYDDWELVVEVTLNTSERQWSAEAEPVPRHIARVMEQHDGPVYGIFAAPVIHPDTAHTFLGVELTVRGQFQPIQIVPLTLDQLESLLIAFGKRRFGPPELRALLEELLRLKEGCRNGLEWIERVSEQFNVWTNRTAA